MPGLPPHVRQKGGQFRAVVTFDKQRRYGKRRDTVAEAEQDAQRLLAERDAGNRPPLTLAQAHADLLLELEAEGAAEATLDYYRNHFTPLVGEHGWGRDFLVTRISSDQIERYAAKRITVDGVAVATAWKKDLQVLDRIFGMLVQRGVVQVSPYKLAKKPKRMRSGRHDVIPMDRLAAAVRKLRESRSRNAERLAAIVSFIFGTGVRRAELARMRVADVEFENRRIWIRGKTGDAYLPLSPLADEAARVLVAGKEPTRPLVGGVRTIERLFARMQEISGEPLLAPHNLRHTTSTALSEAGIDPFYVAAFMRHASPRMTFRYFHASGAKQRDAASQLRLVDDGDHGQRLSSGSE